MVGAAMLACAAATEEPLEKVAKQMASPLAETIVPNKKNTLRVEQLQRHFQKFLSAVEAKK